MKGGDDTELLEYRVSYSLTRGEGGRWSRPNCTSLATRIPFFFSFPFTSGGSCWVS